MYRKIERTLSEWKRTQHRKPLLLINLRREYSRFQAGDGSLFGFYIFHHGLRKSCKEAYGIVLCKLSCVQIFKVRIAEVRKEITYSRCLSALPWPIYSN